MPIAPRRKVGDISVKYIGPSPEPTPIHEEIIKQSKEEFKQDAKSSNFQEKAGNRTLLFFIYSHVTTESCNIPAT